jgi:hypothetical protein
MDDKIEEVRRDIADTRARLSDTLAELDTRVDKVKHAVTHTANPLPAVREHPWLALGLALGAGVAIGMSGADRKAATAVKTGAKKAGPAIKGGVKNAMGAAKERFSGDGPEEATARGAIAGNRLVGYGDEFGDASTFKEEPRQSAIGKVLDGVRDAIDQRLAELTDALLDASREWTGRRPSGI